MRCNIQFELSNRMYETSKVSIDCRVQLKQQYNKNSKLHYFWAITLGNVKNICKGIKTSELITFPMKLMTIANELNHYFVYVGPKLASSTSLSTTKKNSS